MSVLYNSPVVDIRVHFSYLPNTDDRGLFVNEGSGPGCNTKQANMDQSPKPLSPIFSNSTQGNEVVRSDGGILRPCDGEQVSSAFMGSAKNSPVVVPVHSSHPANTDAGGLFVQRRSHLRSDVYSPGDTIIFADADHPGVITSFQTKTVSLQEQKKLDSKRAQCFSKRPRVPNNQKVITQSTQLNFDQ